MKPAFDDPELYQRLSDAGAKWLDGRTCHVTLDQTLARWLIQEARHTAMPADELEDYIEAIPNFGHDPITIYAGLRSIEDGTHRLHAVASSGRAYGAIIRVVGQ